MLQASPPGSSLLAPVHFVVNCLRCSSVLQQAGVGVALRSMSGGFRPTIVGRGPASTDQDALLNSRCCEIDFQAVGVCRSLTQSKTRQLKPVPLACNLRASPLCMARCIQAVCVNYRVAVPTWGQQSKMQPICQLSIVLLVLHRCS